MQTIIVPAFFTRSYLESQLNKLTFIYACDLRCVGDLGQVEVCRGLENCFHVPTKVTPCLNDPKSFWDDTLFDAINKFEIDRSIARIPTTLPVIPFLKIGLGYANMSVKCPLTYKYLMAEIQKIAWPNIEYNYNWYRQ